MTIVKPRTPSGFPEYTPKDQIEFNRLIDIIKTTYELYGFTPLEMDLYGADYSNMVIENANGLGEHLAACGIIPTMAITGSYTNTHQIHVPTPISTIGFMKANLQLLLTWILVGADL